MNYRKLFDPEIVEISAGFESVSQGKGDYCEGSSYVYSQETILAVNVALATGRPLLVRGPSGCGKSTLARSVARVLERRYYETVVTSQTQARTLMWEVDLLRRLQDAQTGKIRSSIRDYVLPGVMWHAFDEEGAKRQLMRTGVRNSNREIFGARAAEHGAVVLLDEIDKADPDVPNNLLVPLGSLRFTVEETSQEVRAQACPLVIITTNDERELPAAFLRRCVELTIPAFDVPGLEQVGRAHFGDGVAPLLLNQAAELVVNATRKRSGGQPPSAAEYLDTVRTSVQLEIDPASDEWEAMTRVTLWKHGRLPTGTP